MSHEYLIVETREAATPTALRTGWITLNRPKQLNALNDALMDELGAALLAFDADEQVGCVVITGSEKAFAAGADIAAMAGLSYADVLGRDFITRNWETLTRIRKPVIAAVAGFALGGGCELAMMCDFIIAASRRSSWASSPAPVARSGCRARWARPRPWTWRSPRAPWTRPKPSGPAWSRAWCRRRNCMQKHWRPPRRSAASHCPAS
jgi:hypothetical protein